MNLQLVILQCLETVHPQMMSRTTLHSTLRLMGRPETIAQMGAAVTDLESRGHVIGMASDDAPGGCRYKVTDIGLVRLREAGL